MEARKGIICGLAAAGVKPQVKQRQPEQSSRGNDVEEITRGEFRRSLGYLTRIEEPEEDIEPMFRCFLDARNTAPLRRQPQAQGQSSRTKAQHGVQDVLNISTEVHVFHRARLEKDHARLEKDHARFDLDQAKLSLGRDEPEDRHGFSPGGPSGHSPLDRGYIKSHSASLDDPFNPSQFPKCRLPSRIISNTQLK
ncbi:hypothetical protein YC2023_072150 [Brassica napus]